MRCVIVVLMMFSGSWAFAESPRLLDDAVSTWLGERDQWAFTQRVREFDERGLKEDRLERYDPSRPDHARWQLLSVNGRSPEPQRLAEWLEKKGRKRKHRTDKAVSEYLDFGHARLVGETTTSAFYEIPLRRDISRFLPVEKVAVTVTVDKESRALEQVSAGLREPFKIAFGIARVTDAALDVRFDGDGSGERLAPDSARPNGSARAVLFKFGNRAEFAWSDFKRVTPYADRLAGAPRPLKDAGL